MKGKPRKPFLLISSNLALANNINQLHLLIKSHKNSGYYQRDPEMLDNHLTAFAEEGHMMSAYIKAIRKLANNNNDYDIVLRPHPNENIKTWKICLEDIPNVHVIREESISAWVKNTFAVMHNGCTTAIEATISGKPVITYNPFQMEYAKPIPNSLGYNINSKEDLLVKVNELFISEKNKNYKDKIKIPEILSRKLYIDSGELAAEKIVKVWESFDNKSLSKANNWTLFYLLTKILQIKRVVNKILNKLFPNNFGLVGENYKLQPLSEHDIYLKVNKLKNLLGIEKNFKCKIISEKTILIK